MTKKTPNAGRINNTDNYRDREPMKREKEYMGEDIGDLGQGKGADRKRLANEIDDNAYDPETEIEIVDNPKTWPEEFKVTFKDIVSDNYKKNLKKYVKIIKKTYEWLQYDKVGKTITSLPSLRSKIGMRKTTWDKACENSEEFEHYSDLIKDILEGRISDSGMNDSRGQIFKIFSIKNLLSEEYQDKKEVHEHKKIEVIEIGGGSAKEIKEAVDKSKKRLKE